MSFVIDHLEYLLQRHDCVTLPRLGALMVRYRPARFDNADSTILLPPSREIAFNGALTESDGLIETSVARQRGISFESARRIVEEEISSLLQQLRHLGELPLGRLGQLSITDYGSFVYTPADSANWDLRFFGVRPLQLQPIDSQPVIAPIQPYAPEEKPVGSEINSRSAVARGIIGIAATLAVIITLALFLLNPIKVEDEPRAASIAPTSIVVVPANTESSPTISLPEEPQTAEISTSAVHPAASPRFNSTDPFCVIVASFPDETQANRYLAENKGRSLGVLQQDGKFRIYAATGTTYEQASSQKSIVGGSDAWICRR